jgi:hypothetical protein
MRRRVLAGLVAATVVSAVSAAVAATRLGFTADQVGTLPDDMRNLDGAREVEIRDQAGQVVLKGTFPDPRPADGEAKAALTGTGTGKGEAELEVEVSNGSQRTELEVDVEGLAPNATYSIHVDGKRAGQMATDGAGKGEIELTAVRQ